MVTYNAPEAQRNLRDISVGLVAVAEHRGVLRHHDKSGVCLTNGAYISAVNAEQPERLRGLALAGCWADDVCWWRNPKTTWDLLLSGLAPDARLMVTVPNTAEWSKGLPEGILQGTETVIRWVP